MPAEKIIPGQYGVMDVGTRDQRNPLIIPAIGLREYANSQRFGTN